MTLKGTSLTSIAGLTQGHLSHLVTIGITLSGLLAAYYIPNVIVGSISAVVI